MQREIITEVSGRVQLSKVVFFKGKSGYICFALLDFIIGMLLHYHLHFLQRRLTVEIRLIQQQCDLEDITDVAGDVLKRPSPEVGLHLTN